VVSFGQAADEVIPALEALIGSPPSDTESEADWVECVGWVISACLSGSTRRRADGSTGVSRFGGREYFGSDGGTTFVTAEGAGIETVYPELQALYARVDILRAGVGVGC
jgi:hypothetical protein